MIGSRKELDSKKEAAREGYCSSNIVLENKTNHAKLLQK
jgi:hypothetical protein